MYGQHNFIKMPLAPLGCAVLIHNKPTTRKTRENHASEGYYIKTSREHYRCYKIWMMKTRSIQVADTIFFKHQFITMSTVSKADTIVVVANKLTQVIREKTESNIGATEQQQLKQLVEAFQKVAKTLNEASDEPTTKKHSGTTSVRTYQNKAKHHGQSFCITNNSQPKPTHYLPRGE